MINPLTEAIDGQGLSMAQSYAEVTEMQNNRAKKSQEKTKNKVNNSKKQNRITDLALLQNYFRIGDDYYEVFDKPNKLGLPERVFTKRKTGTIKMDFGSIAFDIIPKYKDFCLVPDNINYRQIVGDCYNKYYCLDHQIAQGNIENSLSFIKHIFKDKFELGLDYIQLLYTQPTQHLPILCLVSEQNKTGKSTFGQWLCEIFQQNAIKLGNADLGNDFNSSYIEKLLIVVDETSIEKRTISEAIKRMSTEQGKVVVNQKGVAQYSVDFIGKFIFISNREDSFMYVDKKETRYLILKIDQASQTDSGLLSKLKLEIPAFLHYLQNRKLYYPKKDRMYFAEHLLQTEQLQKVKEASKTRTEKAIFNLIVETFEQYPEQIEIRIGAGDIYGELKDDCRWIDKNQIIDCLKRDMKDIAERQASGRYKFYSLKDANLRNESEILPNNEVNYKNRNNSHYLVKVQDFLGENELKKRLKIDENMPINNESINNSEINANGYPKIWD